MKVLYAMIYAPEKGGSGAPIYVNHLLKKMNEVDEKPGILFSVHRSYLPPKQDYYYSFPLRLNQPPIFDNQPKVPHSIAFKDMKPDQIDQYINIFYQNFKKLINKYNYDLLHIQHGMYIGYAASLIKKEMNIPYIITLHIMELNFLPEFPDPILAMKAMVDADRIIALTSSQKKRLLEEYSPINILKLEQKNSRKTLKDVKEKYKKIIGNKKINPNKIRICPLGIDTQLFKIRHNTIVPDKIKYLNLPKDAKIVLYAGRLINMKGIRYLLEAEKIYNKNGDIYTLVFGGGELEEFVKKICMNRKNVFYGGFIEQIYMPLYLNFVARHHGIFSVPSSSEGMSLVYLEAMNCGLRVIACCKKDMGSLDFMQPPNAVFAKFADPKDLAQKITLMFKKHTHSKYNICIKVRKYNIQNMFNKVYSVYKSVIKQPI